MYIGTLGGHGAKLPPGGGAAKLPPRRGGAPGGGEAPPPEGGERIVNNIFTQFCVCVCVFFVRF